MGSNDGESDEKPVHRVTVSNFYIGRYEVTQELYESVMGRTLLSSRNLAKMLQLSRLAGMMLWNIVINLVIKKDLIAVIVVLGLILSVISMLMATGCQQGLNGSMLLWRYKSKGYKYAGGNDLKQVDLVF